MGKEAISIFWFRRDLRLFDNAGLYKALTGQFPVVPIFIFDSEILNKLDNKKDARVKFIHQELQKIQEQLREAGSDLDVRYGTPPEVWRELANDYNVKEVFANRDYEPYARKRDKEIYEFLANKDIPFRAFKDQVIFDRSEIVKDDGDPYIVYTPYSKKWLEALEDSDLESFESEKLKSNFFKFDAKNLPALENLGFENFEFSYPPREADIKQIENYDKLRDYPARDATSHLSIHLRFGTVSIRTLSRIAKNHVKSGSMNLSGETFIK